MRRRLGPTFLVLALDLDVPALAEADHRRHDQRDLQRHEQARTAGRAGRRSSAGSVNPSLVALEPGRRGDRAEDREDDREPGDHREHAAAPAGDEEREYEVDRDEGDLDALGALERLPASDGDDQDDRRGDDQEHDHEQASELRRRFAPIGVLDDHLVFVGHDGATIQRRASGLRRSR